MYTEARAIKSSIIQFVCVHWQIDCALMSLWEYLAQCECVEPSHMIYSITVRDKQFIRGDFGGFANTCWSNFIDWNPFVKSKLRTAPHLPSSTLLLFTVSVSVANTYRRGNLTPPPPPPPLLLLSCPPLPLPPSPGLCLCHSVHLVSLLWPPQSSSAGPQDVEGKAAAAAAARCLGASESSSSNPFFEPLKAGPERVTELRRNWTSDPNCHPSSSKHWVQSSLVPAFTQRHRTTQLQPCSDPCVCNSERDRPQSF